MHLQPSCVRWPQPSIIYQSLIECTAHAFYAVREATGTYMPLCYPSYWKFTQHHVTRYAKQQQVHDTMLLDTRQWWIRDFHGQASACAHAYMHVIISSYCYSGWTPMCLTWRRGGCYRQHEPHQSTAVYVVVHFYGQLFLIMTKSSCILHNFTFCSSSLLAIKSLVHRLK